MDPSDVAPAPSLATLLRYEHPERSRDEKNEKTRSVNGIRLVHNSQRHLHAVGLGLRKLCACEAGADHDDGACACFSADDLGATSLYLSKNNLTEESLAPLGGFRALEVLSLADNVIERVPEVLRGMSKLKRLSIVGNPVMARPHAWEQMIAFRPSLRELNGRRVSESEAQRARNVYKEECMLRNLGYLLGMLRGDVPGEAWVRRLDVVEQVLVDGLTSLNQLSEEFFLFEDEIDDQLGVHTGEVGRSRNHELAIAVNGVWVNSLAFAMSDNVDNESMELMLLEVTSSLLSLESLCREGKEGRQVADVEQLVMNVWRALFSYRDSEKKRQEAADEALKAAKRAMNDAQMDAKVSKMVTEEEADRITRERDALAQELRVQQQQIVMLRAQRDEAIQQSVSLKHQNDTLQKRLEESSAAYESLKGQLDAAMQEYAASKTVIQMISDQLEASNRSESAVLSRNQVLVEELDAANRDRAAAAKGLREADATLCKAQEANAALLAAQKSSYENDIETLRSELDALRREPRIPLRIEVVNPDVTRKISERDSTISQLLLERDALVKEVELLQQEDLMDRRAQSFRLQKVRERMARVAEHCLQSWRATARRRRSLRQLEACLARVTADICRSTARAAFYTWRKQAKRSQVATALGEVQNAKANAMSLTLVLHGWHQYASQQASLQARVDAFTRRRSSSVVHRALRGLLEHATDRRDRLVRLERTADDFAERNRKRIATNLLEAWRMHASLSASKRGAIAISIQRACAERVTSEVLGAWSRTARAAKCDRLKYLSAKRMAERTLQTSVLRALLSHAHGAQERRNAADELSTKCQRAALSQAFRSWRAWNAWRRDLLHASFDAWRAHHLSHQLATLRSSKAGLQASLILIGVLTEHRARMLQDLLEAESVKAAQNDALALKMAASCDTLHHHLSESLETHRKKLSDLAQRHARLMKEKRALAKQLKWSLSDVTNLLESRDELQATCMQQQLSLRSIEDRLKRAENESRHLQLQLRASDAVKSSVQIRAKHMEQVRRTDDVEWSLPAARADDTMIS